MHDGAAESPGGAAPPRRPLVSCSWPLPPSPLCEALLPVHRGSRPFLSNALPSTPLPPCSRAHWPGRRHVSLHHSSVDDSPTPAMLRARHSRGRAGCQCLRRAFTPAGWGFPDSCEGAEGHWLWPAPLPGGGALPPSGPMLHHAERFPVIWDVYNASKI